MIFPYLDLSTGHVSKATMDQLNRQGEENWPAMSIAPYTYGVFVTVPDASASQASLDELPYDLRAVVRFAQGLGVPLLRFDSDGEIVPGLTHAHW